MIPGLWYVTDGARGRRDRTQSEVILEAARAGLGAVLIREFVVGSEPPGPPSDTPSTGAGPISDRAAEALFEALGPAREQGLRVLISRRVDLALAYDLDGVQLTADSVPIERARGLLGTARWIGFSAHGLEQALAAERSGADYVMLSPIFATASKPHARPLGLRVLGEVSARLHIPVLALGGVTPDRTRGILEHGASGVAAVSALGGAADVEDAARRFRRTLAESTACIAPSSASS